MNLRKNIDTTLHPFFPEYLHGDAQEQDEASRFMHRIAKKRH